MNQQLTKRPVVIANVFVGALSLLLVPVGVSGILEYGIPVGPIEGVIVGLFLAFTTLPFLLFYLAYYGYVMGET